MLGQMQSSAVGSFSAGSSLLVNLAFLFTFYFSRNAREWHVMLLAFIFFFCGDMPANFRGSLLCENAQQQNNCRLPPLDCILQAEGGNESTFRKKKEGRLN